MQSEKVASNHCTSTTYGSDMKTGLTLGNSIGMVVEVLHNYHSVFQRRQNKGWPIFRLIGFAILAKKILKASSFGVQQCSQRGRGLWKENLGDGNGKRKKENSDSSEVLG